MNARYLLRFDDICPTMNWEIWAEIEKILTGFKIKPILAVVPDNQDSHLQVAPAHPDFWQQVRRWQSQGWTIGLHGYQHRYVTAEAGIIGFNNYSEFAGLPSAEQEAMLQKGLAIFQHERVRADVWIAPAHSFDTATVTVLKELGLHFINDGFFVFPRVDNGILWVPQQLWDFRPMPFGVWTVCFHHNEWTPEEMLRFRYNIRQYKGFIASFNEISEAYQGHHHRRIELGINWLFRMAMVAKRKIRQRRQRS
jgi:peptidoglycan/xylan/chitin deacetylase (PgdA/CDA1 family)